jgi:hypothetical protein
MLSGVVGLHIQVESLKAHLKRCSAVGLTALD